MCFNYLIILSAIDITRFQGSGVTGKKYLHNISMIEEVREHIYNKIQDLFSSYYTRTP